MQRPAAAVLDHKPGGRRIGTVPAELLIAEAVSLPLNELRELLCLMRTLARDLQAAFRSRSVADFDSAPLRRRHEFDLGRFRVLKHLVEMPPDQGTQQHKKQQCRG